MDGRLLPSTRGGSEIEPHISGHIILGDAAAGRIHHAQAELRRGVPLFGCQLVPLQRFGRVLRDAETSAVREPDFVLRLGSPLFGRQSEPAERFSVVLRDALAALVNQSEEKLRVGVSLFSEQLDFGYVAMC